MVRPGYKVSMGYVPEQGSRALAFTLAFATLAVPSISDELFQEQAESQIDFVQSIYIDNADNAQKLTFQILGGPNQRIVAKANTQGYYPILCPDAKLAYTATTNGAVNVPIIFLNIFVNTIVWATQ